MTPNPYQSPQHTGYDAPKPARLPLWRRVLIAAVVMLLAYSSLAIIVYYRSWFGF